MTRTRSPHVHPNELHRPPLVPLAAWRRPRPDLADELADLADYADPDCSNCHGSGQWGRMPCEPCIVGVWL